jgi:hypothetical protein
LKIAEKGCPFRSSPSGGRGAAKAAAKAAGETTEDARDQRLG